MRCVKFYILRVEYPRLTVQNICGLTVDWEEFWGYDGIFLDVNGEPLLGRISM